MKRRTRRDGILKNLKGLMTLLLESVIDWTN